MGVSPEHIKGFNFWSLNSFMSYVLFVVNSIVGNVPTMRVSNEEIFKVLKAVMDDGSYSDFDTEKQQIIRDEIGAMGDVDPNTRRQFQRGALAQVDITVH
jgi:hypothetical protein